MTLGIKFKYRLSSCVHTTNTAPYRPHFIAKYRRT